MLLAACLVPFFVSMFMFFIRAVLCTLCVQVGNAWSGQCLDSACKSEDMHKPVGLWPCHKQGGNQVNDWGKV